MAYLSWLYGTVSSLVGTFHRASSHIAVFLLFRVLLLAERALILGRELEVRTIFWILKVSFLREPPQDLPKGGFSHEF